MLLLGLQKLVYSANAW